MKKFLKKVAVFLSVAAQLLGAILFVWRVSEIDPLLVIGVAVFVLGILAEKFLGKG